MHSTMGNSDPGDRPLNQKPKLKEKADSSDVPKARLKRVTAAAEQKEHKRSRAPKRRPVSKPPKEN